MGIYQHFQISGFVHPCSRLLVLKGVFAISLQRKWSGKKNE